MEVSTRWMIDLDLPQVYEIEKANFPGNEWTERDFKTALKHGRGIVAISGKEVVGYMVYNVHPKWYELLSLATKYHRIGIGRKLIEYVFRCQGLKADRRIKIEGMVREGNLPAQLFFKSLGFKAVRVVRNHYEDVDEDGYVMQFLVDGCEDFVEEMEESYEKEEDNFC